jgi:2-oxoglutarate dehydrogenase E1 component
MNHPLAPAVSAPSSASNGHRNGSHSSPDLAIGESNLAFVESLYADFLHDPQSVPEDWRHYFQKLAQSVPSTKNVRLGPSFNPRSLFNPAGGNGQAVGRDISVAALQDRVDQLIRNYRVRGHRIAKVDPLGGPARELPELDPRHFGFTEADLNRRFSTVSLGGEDVKSLGEILTQLHNTYCRFIGVQYMHIDDIAVREWLQERMESTQNRVELSHAEQIRILSRLTDAVVFEDFIQKKFQGAKSFSLEGAESLIPLLDIAIEKAADQGLREIVLGMAHRGRLNVLCNIMGKSAQQIFREFQDIDPHLHRGRGDVKYHLGYSSDYKTSTGKKVHMSLCFNPSHLEYVNPVAMGRMRSKQDRASDQTRTRGMTLLIHGDAAFIGEGVVQETLNMSQLKGYTTGGTLHVVVNNQIGFTTDPLDARSSQYATDVAKMLQIPIFHVNGEHTEAVTQVVRLAMEFRQTFQRDVVIDMYCYRLRGHNEGDEPAFTQPLQYKAIQSRDSIRDNYLDHLLTLGEVTVDEADKITQECRARLERDLSIARSEEYKYLTEPQAGLWVPYVGGAESASPDVPTGLPVKQLAKLLQVQTQLPADFHPHPKLKRIVGLRAEMAEGKQRLDWGAAEALAFASLSSEGARVRLSGQDVGRGTFSHRHAVLHDVEDGHNYVPLKHLGDGQAPVEIYNSPLCENGVLGFEYGYSLDCPDGLVLWEAQFGDFVNCAQVIVDQFIVSAEDKWRRLSGLVMLLPHGMEGAGPEHSSARLERFLQLAACDNIQVAYPTTPAQYFHLLRRQVKRSLRKPLIVMTPKSLLRSNPNWSEANQPLSTLEDCAQGTFQRILPDAQEGKKKKVKRVLLCTGKIYYELANHREKIKNTDVAILRVEQLYPLRDETIAEALAPYAAGTPVVWVQEEPANQGAWQYLRARFCEKLVGKYPFSGVSRPASVSPATGSKKSHEIEQQKVLDDAFGDL